MQLDKNHLKEIERHLMVHLDLGITIPVLDGKGEDTGVVVYVGTPVLGLIRGTRDMMTFVARHLTLDFQTNPKGDTHD